jgi:hypothetical protein
MLNLFGAELTRSLVKAVGIKPHPQVFVGPTLGGSADRLIRISSPKPDYPEQTVATVSRVDQILDALAIPAPILPLI